MLKIITNPKSVLLFFILFISFAATAQIKGIASLVKNAPTAALQNVQQAQTRGQSPAPSAEKMTNQLAQQGIRFTENKGQVAELKGKLRPDILFTAHSAGVKLFITGNGIYYQFSRQFEKKKDAKDVKEKIPSKFDMPEVDSTQFYRLDMQLLGANQHPEIIKEGEGSDYENYYLAHCPNGILGVKNFNRITFKNVYPNIDWVVYTKEGALEYDFVVRAGADINNIKLKYSGAVNIKLDDAGNLLATTPLGTVQEHKPLSFIGNTEIASSFKLSNNEIGFDVKDWDEKSELRIDPSIVWSTYYGGESGDFGYSCVTDANNNAYLAGYTSSSSGIVSGGFQNTFGGYYDAFLVKFASNGARIWATYYGGAQYDEGNSCIIDLTGNIYLAGQTSSTTGIASGGFQNNYGGGDYDAFLVKFNSSGVRLWATYYGGADWEEGRSCLSDVSGNIYLVGWTTSTIGIASGGFQNNYGGFYDAFLVKFNSSGIRLWATYYGGTDAEFGSLCALDALGNIYLAGGTYSAGGIASGGFQNTFGGYADAFLVKFNSNGQRLWATYYGGTNGDYGRSCVTDAAGNIYLAGGAYSTDGIASGGFQNTIGGDRDAFLVKFNSSGARLWATYYGGAQGDEAETAVSDGAGNIYIAGVTTSTANIASGGFQNNYGGGDYDAFLVKFNSNGLRIWGTYYGGVNYDYGYSSVIDVSGNIYIAGNTSTTTGIASGGFQNTFAGYYDAFLCKISETCFKPSITASDSTKNVCPGKTVTLTTNASSNYLWSTGETTQSILVSSQGKYAVTIFNANNCSSTSDTTVVTYQTCAKPTGLATSNITGTIARLRWSAVSCAVAYQYEWRKKGTTTWTTAQTTGVTKVITGLTKSTTYQWRVITACKISPDTITSAGYTNGPEFTTLAAAFATNKNTNALIATTTLQALLYPNPTKNVATVSLNNAKGFVTVILSDNSGKLVWQSGKTSSTTISIPIQNLAAGTYMVRVKDEKESVVVKMVKE